MTRFIASSCALLFVLSACSRTGDPPIRNLILISIDTLRADHLGYAGYERQTSPFLDHLAKGGVVFDQCVSQSPWTGPSHATMLSSMYPSVLGMGRFDAPGHIASSVPLLAEVLQDAGFRTHAVVAGGFLTSSIGFDHGFEIYDETGFDMQATVDKALEWTRNIQPDERFFLFMHTYDVHKYKPPSGILARYRSEPYDGELNDPKLRVADLIQNHENAAYMRELAEPDRQYVVDLYDAGITAVDEELRRMWVDLEKRGLLEDTAIVVTADHGEEFWEHGGTGHGYTLYDENLRVPLIVHHESLVPARVAAQVRLLDVTPTIADLLGVDGSDAWQGESLVPMFGGAGLDRSLPAFAEHAHIPAKAARSPDRKLIVLLGGPTQEFYRLAEDPEESVNAVADVAAGAADMREALRRWVAANSALGTFRDAGEGAELSDATIAQLRELGYIGAGPTGTQADPDLELWLDLLEHL